MFPLCIDKPFSFVQEHYQVYYSSRKIDIIYGVLLLESLSQTMLSTSHNLYYVSTRRHYWMDLEDNDDCAALSPPFTNKLWVFLFCFCRKSCLRSFTDIHQLCLTKSSCDCSVLCTNLRVHKKNRRHLHHHQVTMRHVSHVLVFTYWLFCIASHVHWNIWMKMIVFTHWHIFFSWQLNLESTTILFY